MYDDDFGPEDEPGDLLSEGAFVNGEWTSAEDLPAGRGSSPDWWDDEGFGETFEEYMEHED